MSGRRLALLLACGLASAAAPAAGGGLAAEQRACLARRLAGAEPAGRDVGRLEAFAVMDVWTGRLLWLAHGDLLARHRFQPASVFKLVTAYHALVAGAVDPDAVYRCRGRPHEEGPSGGQVGCWLKPGHGPVSLRKALAYSCNLYFARLGGRLAVERLLATAGRCGLGRSTGSDLPGEISGRLPPGLDRRQAARLAVGRAAGLELTGLQLLSLVGAVANGGVLYSPRQQAPAGSATPRRGLLSGAQQLRLLRAAMREASAFGTGAAAGLGRLGVAGKTGTAGWDLTPWRTHGWFVGFWPANRPELALVVFVHRGTGGGTAAPLAAAVVRAVESARRRCRASGGGEEDRP
jgi:penicillin-binding protein 2